MFPLPRMRRLASLEAALLYHSRAFVHAEFPLCGTNALCTELSEDIVIKTMTMHSMLLRRESHRPSDSFLNQKAVW